MIVITGASKGIGKFLFEHYATSGSENVIGTYKNAETPDERLFKLDITQPGEVQDFFSKIEGQLNNLVLINCAGITYNSFAHKSDLQKWNEVIQVNLVGTFNVIRTFLPLMRQQKFGRIINFSSVVAKKPTPGISAYAASKAALWGLSKTVAAENASLNITINNINLGYSELGMISEVPAEYLQAIKEQIPSKKLGEAADILSTVEYLMKTAYINGASIDLNGGII